jgi:hypothetical protein
MLLTYTIDDRDEVARLVAAAREALPSPDAADVVLRALRILVAALDARHDPEKATVGALLKSAGAGAS